MIGNTCSGIFLTTSHDPTIGRYQSFMDAELQQRAVEYGGLATRPGVAKQNVLPMPHWEKRKSLLLRRLAKEQVLGFRRRRLSSLCSTSSVFLWHVCSLTRAEVYCEAALVVPYVMMEVLL